MKIRIFLAWYDLWVGLYVDRENERLYACPLPCVVVCLDWHKKQDIVVDEKVEKRFHALSREWKDDFRISISSNPNAVLENYAYRQIIAMGTQVLPLILKDYEACGASWEVALGHIVGYSPVKPRSRGKSDLVRKDWLEWGRKHDFL